VRTDLSIQPVNLAADALERVVVVRLDCRVALLLEVPDRRLDGGLVDALNVIMAVGVDAERPAQPGQQVLFVQLRIALDRFVLHVFGDVPQFLDRLPLQWKE